MSGGPWRFAVPGDLDQPTGGYAYARRVLAEAGGRLRHLALPGTWPDPGAGAVAAALALLDGPGPVLVDGLALGVLPAEGLARLRGPLVALCHHPLGLETGLAPERAAGLIASERAALARCAAVIVPSATVAATVANLFGVPPARLGVAPPGTDPRPRAAGSGGTGVRIVSVGTLVPRKGHDVLVAALAGVAGDWRLDIYGAARDPGYAAALAARVAAADLGGRVRLWGAVDNATLAAAYRGADVFALASAYEGYGMVFAEALAQGLPVVGCAGGAVAEVCGGAADLVAPGDAAGLRAALARLVADPGARAQAAARSWARGADLPRWPATAARVLDVLARVGAG